MSGHTKYTPGELLREGRTLYILNDDGHNRITANVQPGFLIQSEYPYNEVRISDEECKATAAQLVHRWNNYPAMLEALEEFVNACETAPPMELIGKIGNACRGAKHALAQARGEGGNQ